MSRVAKYRKSLTSAFLSNDLLGSTHYTEQNSFILKTILIFLSFTRYCFCRHISNFITVLARYLQLTHLSASKPETGSGTGSLLYRSTLAHSPFQWNHKIKCNWMCYTYSDSLDCFIKKAGDNKILVCSPMIWKSLGVMKNLEGSGSFESLYSFLSEYVLDLAHM